ncbi:hypothetical protein NDU88_007700 [Pleurodeles waltl]|uniref:Uncharacterized protein n=1 Tax=Pleurodeles waltl TaxID=8319 RepID=A0AAV7QPK3_PLEWA|nr:hypothetical protein NDU88_007700 [Pleurodeles waltl]
MLLGQRAAPLRHRNTALLPVMLSSGSGPRGPRRPCLTGRIRWRGEDEELGGVGSLALGAAHHWDSTMACTPPGATQSHPFLSAAPGRAATKDRGSNQGRRPQWVQGVAGMLHVRRAPPCQRPSAYSRRQNGEPHRLHSTFAPGPKAHFLVELRSYRPSAIMARPRPLKLILIELDIILNDYGTCVP